MIESAGTGQVVERVAERAAENQPAIAPEEANASDATRFREALGGGAQAAPVEAAAEPPAVEPGGVMPASASPGDSILQSLQKMRSDYREATGKVESSTRADGNPSVQDLLRTQMELNRVSMQVDLTAKVVGKATQGIETLVKSQ